MSTRATSRVRPVLVNIGLPKPTIVSVLNIAVSPLQISVTMRVPAENKRVSPLAIGVTIVQPTVV